MISFVGIAVLIFTGFVICVWLGPQHPLHQLDPGLCHQPSIARQIFRPRTALQKVVQKFPGNRYRPCSSQDAWTTSQIHSRSDTLDFPRLVVQSRQTHPNEQETS